MSIRQLARETLTLKPFTAVFLIGAFLLHALVSLCIPVGIATQTVASVALVFLLLTAIARANDIDKTELRWQFRRLGMVAAIGGCAQLLWLIWIEGFAPSWSIVLLLTGFTLSWATTPGQPPWWRFMGDPDPRKEVRPESQP